jgi:hypothetical protein
VGLKFLLHKIRATIKTFDIRILEFVLQDAITKIENGLLPGNGEKQQFITEVNRICALVENNLKTFAKDQGIRI